MRARRDHSSAARMGLSTALAVSLFLMTVLVYTRLTAVDPYLKIADGSRAIANAIGLLHFVVVLWLWSVMLRALTVLNIVAVLASSMLCVVASWLVSSSTMDAFADTLRLYFGRHSWWLVLAVTAVSLPLVRIHRAVLPQPWWKAWGAVCVISLCTGLALYAAGEFNSPVAMLAKIALILIVPTVCLVSMALRYRGPHEVLYRVMSAAGATIGVAVASIR